MTDIEIAQAANMKNISEIAKKIGLEVIKEFSYNNNNYYELVYDTSKKPKF